MWKICRKLEWKEVIIAADISFIPAPQYKNLYLSVFQLLKFQKNLMSEDDPQAGCTLGSEPDLKLHFKYSEKTVHHGQTKRYSHPRTDVSYVEMCHCPVFSSCWYTDMCWLFIFAFRITLQPCFSEIDVSIVDRITALLNPQPLCRRNTKFVSGHMRNVRVYLIFQLECDKQLYL